MLLQKYDIESARDIQDALKDLLGGTSKEMIEAEMDEHLGYSKSERSDSDDYRNGYKPKKVNSSYGSMEIQVPQNRKSTFEPQVVKNRQRSVFPSDIALLKALYLSTFEATKKWTMPIHFCFPNLLLSAEQDQNICQMADMQMNMILKNWESEAWSLEAPCRMKKLSPL